MPSKMIRIAAAILVLSMLALPLAAQPEPGRAPSLSLLAQLWYRIAAPVVALFSSSENDGRGGFDPNGLDSDGRSAWDPNG